MCNVLLVSTCSKKLHEFEFVLPIAKIVKSVKKKINIIHLSKLGNISKFDSIIICGTSLKDFEYLRYWRNIEYILDSNTPLLAICAGMQLVCLFYGIKLKRYSEIGEKYIIFKKNFLGMYGKHKVYLLHNLSVPESKTLFKHFEIFSKTKCIQGMKHRKKDIYCVMFHPEVRNTELIRNFLQITP